MLEKFLISISTEAFFDITNKLIKEVSGNHELKKLLVENGDFLSNYDSDSGDITDKIKLAFSNENMDELAKEIKDVNGYELEETISNKLNSLMKSYGIPRSIINYYIQNFLFMFNNYLKTNKPKEYDRLYQAEWKEEQRIQLEEISTQLSQMNCMLKTIQDNSLDILSADDIDLLVRKQTSPQIDLSFFEIDDEQFLDEFKNQLNNNKICVRARCKEEAVFCLINELWRLQEKRLIFVVRSKDSWDKLTRLAQDGNIYIPWFYADEILPIENSTNVYIYTDGLPSFSKNEIELRPRMYKTIIHGLEEAGLDYETAYDMVTDTHGLYVPIKKKLFSGQFQKKPDWFDGLSEKVKKTCLLVEQWTDADGDKEVIKELCGLDYDDFIDQIMPYVKGEDPFIYKFENNNKRAFCLASIENSWEYLDVSNDDEIWDKFFELYISVLNESEKLFVCSAEDKLKALLKGEELFWSSLIRDGMTRSLIMKSYYKNDFEFQSRLDKLINDLLGKISSEEHWKYLSHFFKDICELSPKAVLDALYRDIKGDTGVINLFKNQNSNFLMEKNHYIGILFGVESFLVQKEYANRAFKWLIMLDNKSLDYVSNSPKDSIEKVLCSWYNFSSFNTVEKKLEAAKIALGHDNNVWDYIYDSLPNGHRSIIGGLCHPKYREYDVQTAVSVGDYRDTADKYFRLLVKHAEYKDYRWKKLLDVSVDVSDSLHDTILEAMCFEFMHMTSSEQMQIKNHIRYLIYRNRFFKSASWAADEAKICKYEKLLDELSISSVEYEYEYLFDNDDFILLNPIAYGEENEKIINSEKEEEIIKEKLYEFKSNKYDLSVLVSACSNDEWSRLGRYIATYYDDKLYNSSTFKTLYNTKQSKRIALDYCRAIAKDNPMFYKDVLLYEKELKYDDTFIARIYEIQAEYTDDIPEINYASESVKKSFWRNLGLLKILDYKWALSECKAYGTLGSFVPLLYTIYKEEKLELDELYDYFFYIENMEIGDLTQAFNYYFVELLKPLQKCFEGDAEKANRIAGIEIKFYKIIEWENMYCFQSAIKRSPKIHSDMASIIFKKDNGESNKDYSEEYIGNIYKLFDDAHFCPAEKNGYVDKEELRKWIEDFKELLQQNDQSSLFGYLIGRLWAYSPVGEDNHYPCESVRNIIEEYADDEMISKYTLAIYNGRGVHYFSAGKNELILAKNYKENADYLSLEYPKTADVFYRLNRMYKNEASNERRLSENGNC